MNTTRQQELFYLKKKLKIVDVDFVKKEKPIFKKIIYCDCFLLGEKNPSMIGGGYTITDDKGVVLKQETFYKENFTNNEGELLAIYNSTKLAENETKIITDSMCAFYWARSGKPKSRPDLKEICQETKKLIKNKELILEWQSREENLAGWHNENYQRVKDY